MQDRSPKKLFQEITSAQDKVRVISQVFTDGIPLVVRVKQNLEFKTKGLNWLPPMRLEVEAAPQEIKLGLQELTVQFDCNDERYFSRVGLAFDDWKLFFIFSRSLFRLQRRQYQRLKIPAKYPNRAFLMNVNEELWNEECEILDLSLGGCSLKLSYRSIDIPVGAVIMMDMQVGNSPSFIVIGQVCYKQLQKFNGISKVKIGVQFRPHPKYAKSLQDVVQKLAADIFSSWSKRKTL